ncbi:MAG: hypothetical protein JRF33_21845 [Deltaproteobacteria bacterium]|nr:hypothetical protein [Deltaproteobacteria bacterium]
MNHWLDLFTGTTWDEFQKFGSNVSGFRKSKAKAFDQIKPGDIFLCYMTGVQRWVGALEILGPSDDESEIWSIDEFPVRFAVKPIILLDAEHGVPMAKLEGKVSFFEDASMKGKYKGFVRGSPRLFKPAKDAKVIMKLLEKAAVNPVARPVDPKKLARIPVYKVKRRVGKQTVEAEVSVPAREDEEACADTPALEAKGGGKAQTRHTEIQHELLQMGAAMGLDVWIARNDRGKEWQGRRLGDLEGVVD